MDTTYENQHVTDSERREFLKVLGLAGGTAAGSLTLGEIREQLAGETASDLAPIGQQIREDLQGKLDTGLLSSQQAAFASAASSLPEVATAGLPHDAPRDDFQQLADAGQPVYEHLVSIDFFESTTTHLSEFTPTFLEKSVEAFVGSEALTAPLADIGLGGERGVDLVATVVANAEQINKYHWVATDAIPRDQIEIGDHIPPMTRAATGGTLLWFGDLDAHLWERQRLLTDDILDSAVWHAHSMAAGFTLLIEGAKVIGEADDSPTLSDDELGALLSTNFAIQAISQYLLPKDAYWITEEMRAPERPDLQIPDSGR